MKLSPPASSSDLDSAREIARRLHLRRQADEPTRPTAGVPQAHGSLLSPPAAALRTVAPSPAKAAPIPPAAPPVRPAAASFAEAPPARPTAQPPAPAIAPPASPAAAPSVFHPPVFQPPALEPPPVPATRPSPPPVPTPAPRVAAKPEPAPARPAPPPPSAPAEWREDAIDSLTPPGLPAIEALGDFDAPAGGDGSVGAEADDGSIVIEETDASIEEIVGSAGLAPLEGAPAGETRAEDVLQEVGGYEPGTASASVLDEVAAPSLPFEDVPTPPDVVSEELFDMPPPPSWGDIAETCMGLGHARGAMLINPSGQVFATRGQWPDPGANAIATKLVAMMEKTLKDAPTRSVSAPLGGMHLTAWRVPLAEGLVTAAFIADAPLRADLRAPIDAQILSGEGL